MNLQEIKESFYNKLHGLYDSGEIGMLYRMTIEEVLGYNLSQLIQYQNKVPEQREVESILEVINRLNHGEPIQYVLKKAWFYGLELEVGPGVLIPRQETELLVNHFIGNPFFESPKKILDIGTGSGCIAIALKKNLPHCKVFAMDISSKAIEITRRNSSINNVEIEIFQADIMNPRQNYTFDAVVSNPPYVCLSEQKQMHRNVTEFEPELALYVKDDRPLLYYETILNFCRGSLCSNGILSVEINERFGEEVMNLFRAAGYKDILLIKDLNNKDRIISGIKYE